MSTQPSDGPIVDDAASVAARDGPEPSHRERLAGVLEDHLDVPMAVLAVVWAGLVTYELIVATPVREVVVAGNVIWVLFILEFVVKLAISGRPVRFLRRRWPSIFFLALPVLRVFRIVRAVRVLRALPAARVVGSSYRTIGTARSLFSGRLTFLAVTSAVVVFSGAQLLYLVEGEGSGREGTFGDALWWTSNAAISGSMVFEPETTIGRIISLALSGYAVVVFASVAATFGAFFIESRAEKAAEEDAAVLDGA